MAKIESQWPGQPPIRVRPGAHHYRLIGLEVTTLGGTRQNSLLNFDAAGDGTSTQSSVRATAPPHDCGPLLRPRRPCNHGSTRG